MIATRSPFLKALFVPIPLSIRSLTHTHAHSHLRMNQPGLCAVCNNVQCVCVLRRRRPRRFIVIVCFAGLSPTRAVFAQCMGVIF
jgi:hypothetical protein